MRMKCPACLHNLELPDGQAAHTCPDCQARFDAAGALLDPVPAPRAGPISPSVPRNLTPYARDLQEVESRQHERDERRHERHEEREFRRDERDFRRDDWRDTREDRVEHKERNALAIVGLALGACAFLMVLGAILFNLASTSTSMKFYLGVTLFLGLPMGLAGLVLSLIGVFYRKVMRVLAIVGVALAALLVFLLVPSGFFLLWS